MDDADDLERFLEAQNPIFERVLAELRTGRKRSHWMWFIFPQLAGLGHSSMAAAFAIASRRQAEAYLAHQILGTRLRQCTQLVGDVPQRSISEIFGYHDDLKFHSSMTLFASVAGGNRIFSDVLEKYFSGEFDQRTIELLKSP